VGHRDQNVLQTKVGRGKTFEVILYPMTLQKSPFLVFYVYKNFIPKYKDKKKIWRNRQTSMVENGALEERAWFSVDVFSRESTTSHNSHAQYTCITLWCQRVSTGSGSTGLYELAGR
jgi:hypothetical protein